LAKSNKKVEGDFQKRPLPTGMGSEEMILLDTGRKGEKVPGEEGV